MMEGGNKEFITNVEHNANSSNRPSAAPHGNVATKTFSVMRRGSVDNAFNKVKSITKRRSIDNSDSFRSTSSKRGSSLPWNDLAERYNCKVADQYSTQLTQRVALAAAKHGVNVPEYYFQ